MLPPELAPGSALLKGTCLTSALVAQQQHLGPRGPCRQAAVSLLPVFPVLPGIRDLVLELSPDVLVLRQEVSAPGRLAQEHCWVVPEPCQSGAEGNEGFANSVLHAAGGLFAWENQEDGAL